MDFVVTWVDNEDPEWREEFYRHRNEENTGSNDTRFRSWDNFHYWFRGVEKFSPWVNKVHFVTWGHVPKWLNINNPKLNIVKHSDFIPEEYLPTFNTRTIELNFHRIKELSEEYVVFNDDVILINHVKPEMFFVDGKPCDMPIIKPLDLSEYSKTIINDLIVINRNFDFKKQILKDKRKWFNHNYGKYNFSNLFFFYFFQSYHFSFKNFHSALPSIKNTLSLLWEKEFQVMNKSCSNKFRDSNSVNNYVQRYWDLASNNFHPFNPLKISQHYDLSDDNLQEVIKLIHGQSKSIVCINDSQYLEDFHSTKKTLNNSFNRILSEKSSFEI